jgi:phosphate transport system substrate-binding protein
LFGRTPARVDSRLPDYQPAADVAGVITCAGAVNLDGIVQRWARDFMRAQPAVRIDVDTRPRLSSEGLQALLDGRAQLAPFARELFPSEIARFVRRFGHPPLVVCIGLGSYDTPHNTDAIAIYVNAANPLRSLSLTQLDAILSATRRRGAPGAILTWGRLGLTGDWAARPIHPYGMVRLRPDGDPPCIVNFLEQRLLLGGGFSDRVREQTDRAGITALDAIVRRVARDPAGIGYSGFGNARPGVRALALAEADGTVPVAGTPATVAAGAYPLTRRVYLCLDCEPGRPLPPAVAAFLRYALSRQGQEVVAADASGYLPLSAVRAAAERARFE